jgi:hypothetical protein
MRVQWRTVGDICARVEARLEESRPPLTGGLVRFGVDETSYVGGRLENYVAGEENRRERLDLLAQKVHTTLCRFEELLAGKGELSPYDVAIRLEEEIECWKQP